MSKALYHLTDKKNLDSILSNGLIPQIGPTSKLMGEERNTVFLCEEKDIGKWRIILDKNVLLRIDGIDESGLTKTSYSEYDEYAYDRPILPANIRLESDCVEIKNSDMKVLCSSYLITMSVFATICAEFEEQLQKHNCHNFSEEERDAVLEKNGVMPVETLVYLGKSLTVVLPRLDYRTADMTEWSNVLKEYGSMGEYSFCDTYKKTGKRLWQMLNEYDISPECNQQFRTIYKFIADTFPFAYSLNTGGWGT